MSHINDNVYQNIDNVLAGVKRYHNVTTQYRIRPDNNNQKEGSTKRVDLKKDPLWIDEKVEIAE